MIRSKDLYAISPYDGHNDGHSHHANKIENGPILIIPDMEDISVEDYFKFLQILENHKNRHEISQSVIDKIVEAGLKILESIIRGDFNNNFSPNPFSVACLINDAFQLYGDFTIGESEELESITDKSFRSVIKLHNKYPQAALEMENLFGQNHTVQPRVLMSVIADACGDPETSKQLIQELIFSLNYILSFGGNHYDEALISQLDFKNPENIYKTARFLELIQRLMNVSSDYAFSEKLIYKLTLVLIEATEDDGVNYFLSVRARKILADINDEGYSWTRSSSSKEYKRIDDGLLINPKSNRSEEEIQRDKNDLVDFHYLMSSSIRDYIEEEFGLDLDSLGDQEKFYFLKLIKIKSRAEIERIKNFTGKFGASGFKTFLSIDYGIEMGDRILKISEGMSHENAQRIFDKYGELVSQTDNVGDVLNDAYGRASHGEEVVKIKESILKKGKELLEKFSDMLEQSGSLSEDDILSQLNRIEVEATTFFLTFKTLKEKKQLPAFEEIKGISFAERNGGEISADERIQMERIYRDNYKDNPALADELISKLRERLDVSGTRFYSLKYQDSLKAFIGFTPSEECDSLVFHSFNVEASLRGISIGNTMMEKALDMESESSVLEADCAAYEAIGARYVEGGCIADSFYLYKNNPSLHIVRNNSNNKNYWGKRMVGKEADLIGQFENGELPDGVVVESSEDQKNINMSLLSNGFVLSRYFKFGAENKWYAVFEKAA